MTLKSLEEELLFPYISMLLIEISFINKHGIDNYCLNSGDDTKPFHDGKRWETRIGDLEKCGNFALGNQKLP